LVCFGCRAVTILPGTMKSLVWGSSAAILLIGCSDATAPAPGTFRARLNGARVVALSGVSNAGPFFSVQYPDARLAIRMFATDGDTVRAIVIHCPGQDVPSPGTYAVSPSESDCGGSYSRVVSTQETGIIVLEQASASSGSVTINSSDGSQAAGTFSFQGTLVVGSDTDGTLTASGAFSAAVGP
jgi:hypothetical protein